jgi:adenosylcobinamide-phosphate synthase
MSFAAVLLALLIEQLKPLPRDNWVHEWLAAWVRWTGRNFDAGKPHHTVVVWAISVGVPTLVVLALYLLAAHFSLLLALAIDVALLYLTLGFRQFSHYYTDIRDALDRGDEALARRLLGEWRHLDASELPRTELLRHVIEHSLLAAHRHVFGVFFWFVVLSALGLGPAGAVLYRMAEFSSRYWGYRQRTLDAPHNDRLLALSRRLFAAIDHVPARLTAFGFAVVGNFEGAVALPERRDHPGRRGRRSGHPARWRGRTRGHARPVEDLQQRCRRRHRRGRGFHRGYAAAGRAPAERGWPGLALGGAVDVAGGAAVAGQRAGLIRPGRRTTLRTARRRSPSGSR